MPLFFLASFFVADAIAATGDQIDVTLTVPSVPITTSNSTFNCNPKEVIVGGNIYCHARLINSQELAIVNEPVKVTSSRNISLQIDTITPVTQNTDGNGYANFNITSNNVGEGMLRAIIIQDGSQIGNPVAFKFLSETIPIPSLIFSDITADKTRLYIGKDKATISVKILDQNKNPMPSLVVTLLYNAEYGESEQEKNLTDDTGTATFTYTPKKKGVVEIGAMTNAITLDKKVILEILEEIPPSQSQIQRVAEEIASILNPVITTVTALSLISFLTSLIGGVPAFLHAFMYLISLILDWFGVRRKKKSWGRVYDSITRKGVDLALVRLYNEQTGKLAATIITNSLGRYNFQPKPGTYAISVIKEGFIYPTQILAKCGIRRAHKIDTKFFNRYLGQSINITGRDDFLNIDIPIDPVTKEFSFFLKTKIWMEDVLYLFIRGLSSIFIPILILGTIASVFVAIVLSGKRNIIVAIAYSLLALIYIYIKIIRSSQFGLVVDEKGKPISGVMISIFEKKYNTLKETMITDQFGRFSIFVEAGEYLLMAQKNNYEFRPENLEPIINKYKAKNKFTGQIIKMTKSGHIKVTVLGKNMKNENFS